MKKSYQFFGLIVLVVLVLIAVLVATQINSASSIERLVLGNKQAEETFLINNRLEEMVNLSFEIESKIVTAKPPYSFAERPGLADSLSKLKLKADALEKIISEPGMSHSMMKVINLAKLQAQLSTLATATGTNGRLIDSLRKNHFGDSIYLNAVAFQVEMEKALKETLYENNLVAGKVSLLNKVLAITALVAILLLGTIIIRRQVTQFILIRDLEKARKLALESAEVKDQFLANMSHEIRTPLNAVKGFSNLLSKTRLTEEQQRYAGIISSSSESLLHIVNDILDLSKMEAGAWSIKNKPFSLSQLLEELELMYATLAVEKSLAFKVTAEKDLQDNLIGDAERLKQVLMNLLSNAIKFTKQGAVNFAVSFHGEAEESVSVHFVVADTGIGIPKDKIDHIFERFEQLDNAFTRQQGGTGLGLSITKMIVESMGGYITVESEPGKGSVFSFTLRFKINKEPGIAQRFRALEPANVITDTHCNKVLLAEDNKINQLLIQKYLAPFNVEPVVVQNGNEVLALLEEQPFDVVLMDVQMPVMDGIETTRQIRARYGEQLPVIGLTAYVQPNEIEKCFAAGMNEYISKPINEHQFLSVLEKYIYLEQATSVPVNVDQSYETANFAFLEKMCNGNTDTMKLILDTMRNELPKDRDMLAGALEQKDTGAVAQIVHHIRSTILPLGERAKVAASVENISGLMQGGGDWPATNEAGIQLLKDMNDSIELLNNNMFNL